MKQRLLASTTLSRAEKNTLMELLLKNSKEQKNRDESEEKFVEYFSTLYNKYLIPNELAKDIKKSSIGFIKQLYGIQIVGSTLFDICDNYPDDSSDRISTTQTFSLKTKLVDVRYIYTKNEVDANKFSVEKLLIEKINPKEKSLLKNLFCNFIEDKWAFENYLKEYRGFSEHFPKISTWDQLYKLNPEWYDLLYNQLTYYHGKAASLEDDCDLLSKTLYDREINEATNIDVLIKKVINYINE